MAERRGYGDPCGIARGLDVVGTRWALLVVRELLLGPKRFGDLRAGLPGMSAETLGQRLRQLEEEGVVRRTTLPPPASVPVYELTDWGHELRPVVLALGRWGSHAPFPPGDASLSPDSMMLALATMFDPARARDVEATYGVRLGEHAFRVRVVGGELDLARGGAGDTDAVIATDTATLPELLWRDLPVEEAEKAGALEIEGSRRAARRFLGLFRPSPQPARTRWSAPR